MAGYSYQSSSYATGNSAVDAAFKQADTNADGGIDLNEFRSYLSGQGHAGSSLYTAGAGFGASGSSLESASFESSSAGAAAAAGGAGFGASYVVDGGLVSGGSTYETVATGAGFGGAAGFSGAAGFASGAGYATDAAFVAGGAVQDAGATTVQTHHYAADSQGLFHDPNPQIIRRPAAAGVQTYTQNIKVRFLQPPPVPPHGPLIIKEVRPPQPPLPPPLRIRQQAPPLPTPPPLVLREKPPQPPAVIAAQTVIRRLAALPVPPRSVIIERLPPLPPKPRDIIIERWVPYPPQAKRRVILQRAAAAKPYPQPRNIIIQYEPVQVRVVRQFQRLGVTAANPAAYVQQYGAQLLDANVLLQQARAAGVVEDISPPAGGYVGYSSASYGQDASFGAAADLGSGASFALGGDAAFVSGGEAVVSSGGASSAYGSGASFVSGGGATYDAGLSGGFNSSSFDSSAFSVGSNGAVDTGFVAGAVSGYGGSTFGTSNYSTGYNTSTDALFASADVNHDGTIDQAEFRQFLGQHI